ncbi:MAG: 50S ribosomal protein L6 [Deltaproteobacteria bacterium]|nr:50S ribosomal protein L6 [Deltaproteobacteria bacterium]
MSRIGKQPMTIPEKVTVTSQQGNVTVKGPLGTLMRPLHPCIRLMVTNGLVTVERTDDTRVARSVHGLSRALIANMIHGVTVGFTRALDLVGVGYRAELKGNTLLLSLGYSNPVEFPVPQGIKMHVEKQTRITLSSVDNELLGETASHIRRKRPPEPYKGKGARYVDEVVRKKAGKSAGAGASAGATK